MWFINSLLLIHFAWPVFEYLKPLVLMVTCLERRLQGPYHIKVSTVSSSDRATWQIWYTCVTNFFLSVQHHHLMCTNILYILCIQLLILKKRRKRLKEIQGEGGGGSLKPYCRCTWVQQSQSYAADASWCPTTKLTKK